MFALHMSLHGLVDGLPALAVLDGYAKLHREMSHLERKDDPRAAAEHRKRWKTIHKAVKTHMKRKRPELD